MPNITWACNSEQHEACIGYERTGCFGEVSKPCHCPCHKLDDSDWFREFLLEMERL